MSKQDENRIQLPEMYSRRELNKLYREIPLTENAFRRLRKYFSAMSDLYGIIPVGEAWKIISGQCPKLVDEEKFRAFVEVARHEREGYCILRDDEVYLDGKRNDLMEWEIIDLLLLIPEEDKDQYAQVKELQQGKPYYVPDKETFLYYDPDDLTSCERQWDAMFAFLKSVNRRADEDDAGFLTLHLAELAREGDLDYSEAMDMLDDWGWELTTNRQMERFVALFSDMHNHSRLQCNRGFTPSELVAIMPRDKMPTAVKMGANMRKMIADGTIDPVEMMEGIKGLDLPSEELRQNMLKEIEHAMVKTGAANRPSEALLNSASIPMWPGQKVSRNDPCPCGSGRKYKNCCGKVQ